MGNMETVEQVVIDYVQARGFSCIICKNEFEASDSGHCNPGIDTTPRFDLYCCGFLPTISIHTGNLKAICRRCKSEYIINLNVILVKDNNCVAQ